MIQGGSQSRGHSNIICAHHHFHIHLSDSDSDCDSERLCEHRRGARSHVICVQEIQPHQHAPIPCNTQLPCRPITLRLPGAPRMWQPSVLSVQCGSGLSSGHNLESSDTQNVPPTRKCCPSASASLSRFVLHVIVCPSTSEL